MSKGLAGERSVGVRRAEETEAGEKSGELGDVSMFKAKIDGLLKGAGELRFSVRRSCSTCWIKVSLTDKFKRQI